MRPPVRLFLLVFAVLVLVVVSDALTRAICEILPIGLGVALAVTVISLLGVFIGPLVLFKVQLASEFDSIRETLRGAVDGLQAFLDRAGLGEAVNGSLLE